ncbi:MAG: hypothetical protein OCD00_15955 [Colwellia sp.]
MKILLIFILSIFLYVKNVVANNDIQTASIPLLNDVTQKQPINLSASSSYFSINHALKVQTLPVLSLDNDIKANALSTIKTQYQYSIIQLETGWLSQDNNPQIGQAFYLQGALVIHQSSHFNFSVMANIEHQNEQYLSLYQNNLYNITETNQAIFNTNYGLVGSYLLTPSWQLTGGVIYSTVYGNLGKGIWNKNDNMALIGTTYSF